ncbi:putative protein12 [Kallithea virus]|uniref:Uncharacterized protein n=1 Tax=Kallithea virus TaxID=1654582 RepID=A0A1S5VFX8_9VIRU|nr:putative protein12 [Kallithea virus]AQN78548.1 putative protein12 [Kallithea virus]
MINHQGIEHQNYHHFFRHHRIIAILVLIILINIIILMFQLITSQCRQLTLSRIQKKELTMLLPITTTPTMKANEFSTSTNYSKHLMIKLEY